jgi:hypothetical protein
MNKLKIQVTTWRVIGFIFLSLFCNLMITVNLLSRPIQSGSIASQWTDTSQLAFQIVVGTVLFILCEIAAFSIFTIDDKR